MTTYDDTHLGRELWKLGDLASRPVHLARLHFEVLFANKLYCEESACAIAVVVTIYYIHSTGSSLTGCQVRMDDCTTTLADFVSRTSKEFWRLAGRYLTHPPE